MPMKKRQLNVHTKSLAHNPLSAEQEERLRDAIQRGDRALVNVFVRAIKNGTLKNVKQDLAKK